MVFVVSYWRYGFSLVLRLTIPTNHRGPQYCLLHIAYCLFLTACFRLRFRKEFLPTNQNITDNTGPLARKVYAFLNRGREGPLSVRSFPPFQGNEISRLPIHLNDCIGRGWGYKNIHTFI